MQSLHKIKKLIENELEETQEKAFQAACKMKRVSDLAGKKKPKRKCVRAGRESREAKRTNINMNQKKQIEILKGENSSR